MAGHCAPDSSRARKAQAVAHSEPRLPDLPIQRQRLQWQSGAGVSARSAVGLCGLRPVPSMPSRPFGSNPLTPSRLRRFACLQGIGARPIPTGLSLTRHEYHQTDLCWIEPAFRNVLSLIAAVLEKVRFFRRHRATEDRIAVRETTKVPDDVAMTFSMFQPGLAQLRIEQDGDLLI